MRLSMRTVPIFFVAAAIASLFLGSSPANAMIHQSLANNTDTYLPCDSVGRTNAVTNDGHVVATDLVVGSTSKVFASSFPWLSSASDWTATGLVQETAGLTLSGVNPHWALAATDHGVWAATSGGTATPATVTNTAINWGTTTTFDSSGGAIDQIDIEADRWHNNPVVLYRVLSGGSYSLKLAWYVGVSTSHPTGWISLAIASSTTADLGGQIVSVMRNTSSASFATIVYRAATNKIKAIDVMYSSSSNFWTTPEFTYTAATSATVSFPQAVADTSGNLYIAFDDSSAGLVFLSSPNDHANGYTSSTLTSAGPRVKLCGWDENSSAVLGVRGNDVVLAYTETISGTDTIGYKVFYDGGWSAEQTLPTGGAGTAHLADAPILGARGYGSQFPIEYQSFDGAATYPWKTGFASLHLPATFVSQTLDTPVLSGAAQTSVTVTSSFDEPVSVTGSVKDAGGSTIATMPCATASGALPTRACTWDGRTSSGTVAPEGRYTLSVTATNNLVGTVSFERTRASFVDVDLTPPTASFSVASNQGWVNSRNVSISWSGSDPINASSGDLASLWASHDAVPSHAALLTTFNCAPTCGTQSGTSSWSVLAGDGSKTVYLWMKDRAGNAATGTVSITLDTVAPAGTLSLTGLDNGRTNNRTVNFALTQSDGGPYPSGPSSVAFSCDGTIPTVFVVIPSPNVGNCSVPVNDGLKQVRYLVEDTAGNISQLLNSTLILDTTGPTLSALIASEPFFSPNHDSTKDSTEIQGSVLDQWGPLSWTVRLKSADGETARTFIGAEANFAVCWDGSSDQQATSCTDTTHTLGVRDGTYTTTIIASDGGGNAAEASGPSVTVDTVAPHPIPEELSPREDTMVTNDQHVLRARVFDVNLDASSVSFGLRDASSGTVSLLSGSAVHAAPTSGFYWTDPIAFEVGHSYRIELAVRDRAGNSASLSQRPDHEFVGMSVSSTSTMASVSPTACTLEEPNLLTQTRIVTCSGASLNVSGTSATISGVTHPGPLTFDYRLTPPVVVWTLGGLVSQPAWPPGTPEFVLSSSSTPVQVSSLATSIQVPPVSTPIGTVRVEVPAWWTSATMELTGVEVTPSINFCERSQVSAVTCPSDPVRRPIGVEFSSPLTPAQLSALPNASSKMDVGIQFVPAREDLPLSGGVIVEGLSPATEIAITNRIHSMASSIVETLTTKEGPQSDIDYLQSLSTAPAPFEVTTIRVVGEDRASDEIYSNIAATSAGTLLYRPPVIQTNEERAPPRDGATWAPRGGALWSFQQMFGCTDCGAGAIKRYAIFAYTSWNQSALDVYKAPAHSGHYTAFEIKATLGGPASDARDVDWMSFLPDAYDEVLTNFDDPAEGIKKVGIGTLHAEKILPNRDYMNYWEVDSESDYSLYTQVPYLPVTQFLRGAYDLDAPCHYGDACEDLMTSTDRGGRHFTDPRNFPISVYPWTRKI